MNEKKNELSRTEEFPFLSWLDDAFTPSYSKKEYGLMKTDVKDEGKDYKFLVEVPGVDKKNIKVSLNDGYLLVSAHYYKTDKGENANFVHSERVEGNYQRSFFVGKGVKKEDIKGSLNNGVLTIVVPKVDPNKELENDFINID